MESLLFLVLVAGVFIWFVRLAGRGKQNTLEAYIRRYGSNISGKPYVVDGDGIKVKGVNIRFAGLDAPEHDQLAVLYNGNVIEHGAIVKSTLIKKIGGRYVDVEINDLDKYGRLIGTVKCNDEDIGRWLVENGHAISAYGYQYKKYEQTARRMRRGMWGYKTAYSPQAWRFGRKESLFHAASPSPTDRPSRQL